LKVSAANDDLRWPHGLLLGPDNFPLAAPITQLAPKGVVDGYAPPNHFFGWAGFLNAPEDLRTRVVIKLGGEIIGSGEPTFNRPDVMGAPQPAGFAISASRALSHEEIASGALSAEASAGPHHGPLLIPSYIASRSFDFVALAYLARSTGWDRDDVAALIGYAEAEEFSYAAKRKLLSMLAVLNKGSRSRRLEELAASASVGLKDGAVIGAPASASALNNPEVVSHFEGVGHNCEFGFVQRHFGADPASLLRWASIPYDLLIKALQNRFSGVGDPTYTTFEPFWGDGEYAIRDTRYELTAHTQERDVPKHRYEALFTQHCKRLAWLRRAFVESLEESVKIFVRADYEPLTVAQAHALFGELNKYGHNRLLIVRADRERDGAVEILRPDLCVGYISSFSREEAVPTHVQHDSWLAMLRNALTMFAD
jgi:hypothetical protein